MFNSGNVRVGFDLTRYAQCLLPVRVPEPEIDEQAANPDEVNEEVTPISPLPFPYSPPPDVPEPEDVNSDDEVQRQLASTPIVTADPDETIPVAHSPLAAPLEAADLDTSQAVVTDLETLIVPASQEPSVEQPSQAWAKKVDLSFLERGASFMFSAGATEVMQSTPIKKLGPRNKGRVERQMKSVAQRDAFQLLRRLGVNPLRVNPKDRREVVAERALLIAARESCNTDPESRETIKRLCMSKVVEESGTQTRLQALLGIDRSVAYRMKKRVKKTFKSGSITRKEKKKRQRVGSATKRKMVEKFYLNDQISRQCPGKNDWMKNKDTGEERVKRVLTDYIKNIHARFLSEYPEVHISRTTFRKWKPWYVLLCQHLRKDTAMCTIHQNFALRLYALRQILPNSAEIPKSPDEFVKKYTNDEVKQMIDSFDTATWDGNMRYHQWKPVTDKNDGKTKTRKIAITVPMEEFLADFFMEYLDFAQHASRVIIQYGQLKDLKRNLKPGEMVIQVDFSENWFSQCADSVQGAYFNQSQTTLHCAVAWWREGNTIMKKAFLHCSPVNAHGADMIHAIMSQTITEDLKDLIEEKNIRRIHYWSDSPTSQYRNRFMFHFIATHEKKFGIIASWDYFEAGHGKGPCDGVGAVAKRLADMAQRHGKDIQDAWDFYRWATESTSVHFEVFFITKEVFEKFKEEVDALRLTTVPVRGTMKLHAVRTVPGKEGYVEHRKTSCKCLELGADCPCEWTEACIMKEEEEEAVPIVRREVKVDDWVIIEYNTNVYYGQVKEVHAENGNCHVKCMESKGRIYQLSFQWPKYDDWCLSCQEDILAVVEAPVASARRGNTYMMTNSTKEVWRTFTEK